MKLTKDLLHISLRNQGYSDREIVNIHLTKDYTNSDVAPEINLFTVKLRLDYFANGTINVLEEWSKKFGFGLQYWKAKSEGWSNLDADKDATTYYMDVTFKFRRIGK